MTNQPHIYQSIAILSVLLPACGGGSGGAEGGQGVDPPAKGVELWCNYGGQNGFAYLCVEEKFCADATAAKVCSMYFEGNLDRADLWKDSKLMGPCNDGSGPLQEMPQAPCACDHGTPEDNDVFCDPPPPLDQYDYPDGYPLPPGLDTGDPTTSGGDLTTGGDEPTSLKEYVCGDGPVLQQKCVFYEHVVAPLQEPDKICWVQDLLPDTYTVCLSAFDDVDALNKCTAKCGDFKKHAEGEIKAHQPADTPVEPTIDCVLEGAGEVPRLKTAADSCDPGAANYLVAWGGTSILRPFSASAVLGTSSGGSTSSRDLVGYLGYQMGDCTRDQCNLTIDALEGAQKDIPGIFTDAGGVQISYLIEDLDFRIMQDVQGVLNVNRGTITFPSDSFAGIVYASSYSVGGVPMGGWASPIFVSQAVGSVNRRGDLTLNLTFNWADGTFTVSFVTH